MNDANLTRFDASGKITCLVTVPASMRDLQGPNHIDGHFDAQTIYVVNGQALARPACPAVLDGFTLREMPAPSTLLINDQPHAVTEATVELAFAHPGVYTLRVVCWPYIDGNYTLTR